MIGDGCRLLPRCAASVLLDAVRAAGHRTMTVRTLVVAATTFTTVLLPPSLGLAQQGSAQSEYDREIAACNAASMAAPARNACVRDAGRRLDRLNGGTPPKLVLRSSADGRAIVMTPPDAPAPPSASDYIVSPDGRSVTARPPSGDSIAPP